MIMIMIYFLFKKKKKMQNNDVHEIHDEFAK